MSRSRKSELFNAPDADVVFQSSDDVLFSVHRVNLQTHTEGFPPAEIVTEGEICPLPESSATLEVLFQFIYPRRHPSLDNFRFEAVAALAEAAEKYQVYSAMNICHLRMKEFLPANAAEILTYAAKHDYPTVVAEVAPILIDLSLVDIVQILPPHILLPWVKYREEWEKVVQQATSSVQKGHVDRYGDVCRHCSEMRPFGLSIHSLRHFESVLAGPLPDYGCLEHWNKWKADVNDRISSIPKFTTFL
ncbi:hypothetical protein B0H11DRAFT_2130378 [Mycena galericulata]|nr:hypothetical protein B0H11DRAFT_2130378 [Mycena galericulata]